MADRWDSRLEVITTFTNSGSGALAETLTVSGPFKLVQFELTIGVQATTVENLVVTKVSKAGSDYNSIIKTRGMASINSYVWKEDPILCTTDDTLTFVWTNTDDRTWGLTIQYRRLR